MTTESVQLRAWNMLEVRDVADDGRQLYGLVAPYGEEYDAGGFVETFAPGVFRESIRRRPAVGLKEQHNRDAWSIGYASDWEDRSEGLFATFDLNDLGADPKAKLALTLVEKRNVTGLSVGFVPIRNRSKESGGRRYVTRIEAALDHVGLVEQAAYSSAKVLASRDDDAPFDPDSMQHAPRLAYHRALLKLRGS